MESFKTYLISLCAAAVICCIVSRLAGEKGSISSIVKLLCGLFMLTAIASPVITLPIGKFQSIYQQIVFDAEAISESGKEVAKNEIDSIIQEKTQALIVERAASLGAIVDVEVLLCDSTPTSVYIYGAASPYIKIQISDYITKHLGVEAGNLCWIG